MKIIAGVFLAFIIFSAPLVHAQTNVPQGGTGLTSVPLYGLLVGDTALRLKATTSPTVGSITATSTTATSTFNGPTDLKVAVNFLGEYITNFTNYVRSRFSATLPISLTTGVISIADAIADGATKGAATFTAADFNSTSGNISIDYTNGQAAASGVKGFLTAADWATFNGKQAAGNYITALTGDVAASGPGSVAATLASVITAGSCTNCNLTYDAKGRLTVATNGASGGGGAIATSTNLVAGQVDVSTGVNTIGNFATFLFDSALAKLTVSNASTTNLSIGALSGILKQTGGVVVAAAAGTDYQAPITATYPVQFSANVVSLAFGTTTSNTWAGTQTFTNPPVFTGLTGSLYGVSGAVKAVATSTQTVGNGLSTTGSSAFDVLGGTTGTISATLGTTIAPNELVGTPAANLVIYTNSADTGFVGAGTSTPALASEFTYGGTLGQFISGSSGTLSLTTNGTALNKLVQIGANTILGNNTGTTGNVVAFATSTLGIAISDTTGTLAVNRGGTGAITLTGVLKGNGASAFTAASNGTDFTLITGITCTNQVLTAFTAAGVGTCATVSNAMLANSTISGVALGGTLFSHSVSADFTGTAYNGSAAVSDWLLKMSQPHSWTGLQTFTQASSTLFSVNNTLYVGGTATTTISVNGSITMPSGSTFTKTGVSDGCATWASGVLGTTGLACGSGGGGAGSNGWATTSPYAGQVILYPSDTTADVLFGAISTTTSPFWFDVSATTSYIGNGGTGDSALTTGSLNNEWTLGYKTSDKSFRLSSSTALGTNDVFSVAKATLLTTFSNALTVVGQFTAAALTATGVVDFGSATSLKIPQGSAPTVSAAGQIAVDLTSDQFIFFGASKRVVSSRIYPAFSYATSTAWTGTTTIPLGPAYVGETWDGVKCFTDTGTLQVSFNDGTNRMNWMNASTTVGTVALTTNNTFTAGTKRFVDVGTPASTPTKISCTVNKTITAD